MDFSRTYDENGNLIGIDSSSYRRVWWGFEEVGFHGRIPETHESVRTLLEDFAKFYLANKNSFRSFVHASIEEVLTENGCYDIWQLCQ
jgi:hypothetical protein